MPEVPESTSSSLIRRVRCEDPEAWRRLVDLYSPLVYCWCRRAGLQAEDAADVLQEVFRAVSSAMPDFRHGAEGETFRGWLRVMARNKIRDHFRLRRGRPVAIGGTDAQVRIQGIADEESASSEQPSPWTGLYRRALAVIQSEFEESTWKAFWGVAVDGQPAADVAERLGMSPGAVRQAKYRVLRRLRVELGDVE